MLQDDSSSGHRGGRGRWAAEAREGWARPQRKKEKRAIRQPWERKFQAPSFQAPVSG